jgi:hypothetical protein
MPRVMLALLVLALVLVGWADCMLAPCSAAIQDAPCKLPSDILQWSRIPGFAGTQRVWDTSSLRLGMRHMGGLYHAKKLLDKLNQGVSAKDDEGEGLGGRFTQCPLRFCYSSSSS